MGTQTAKWFFCALSVVIAVCAGKEDYGETRQVHTSQGSLIGHRDQRFNGHVFYDVPYATAPTGTDRFKAPLPPPTWKEPYNAVNRRIMCPQVSNPFTKNATGILQQEDCLVATLYVPDSNKVNLPVYVYVHGGGFQIGFGNMVSPTELLKMEDIIIVTFNYRLGVHGFLCLGTEKAPGNAGMKDQVALLRWVRRNIANFHGNPDDVTISGGSAGAAAVDLLLLSPSAKGLFHKIITESGSNLSPFSLQLNPLKVAKDFAKSKDFVTEDVYALENFFTTASYEVLYSAIMDFGINSDTTVGLTLCVERPTGEEMFLDDTPYNILVNGNYVKVPLLYGFADMDGIIMMPIYEQFLENFREKFSDNLPENLKFESKEQKEVIANKVKEFYFGNTEVTAEKMISPYINLYSDVIFAYPTIKSLKLLQLSGHQDIHLYLYTYSETGGTPIGYKDYKVNGANHCAQSMAVFDGIVFITDDESTLSNEFRKNKEITRKMWINFIKFGEPVPEGSSLPAWPPTSDGGFPYMNLGYTAELQQGSVFRERMLFWEEIYKRHYSSPVSPPAPPIRHLEL